MTITLIVLAGVALAYVALVRWRLAQPRQFVYNTWMAWILLRLCRGMVCTTLWHTAYEYQPDGTPGYTLLPDGRAHEAAHMDQWDRHPYTFPVRYLWELVRRGYGCNRFEEEARRVAGEPSECPGGTTP